MKVHVNESSAPIGATELFIGLVTFLHSTSGSPFSFLYFCYSSFNYIYFDLFRCIHFFEVVNF
jgi:hypothetical protein